MKKNILLGAFSILILGTAMLFHLSGNNLVARVGPQPPTAAPRRPTPGPTQPLQEFNGPYLENPLTREDALKLAIKIDSSYAVWNEPWAEAALTGPSDRVTVNWYPICNYRGNAVGKDVECGPVWVVSINGKYRNIGFKSDNKIHDGISYTIAQRTGHLLGVRIGPWPPSQ